MREAAPSPARKSPGPARASCRPAPEEKLVRGIGHLPLAPLNSETGSAGNECRPKMCRFLMPSLLPSIALALVLSVLDSGTSAADLVAGGWLTPPQIPQAAPPPPPRVVVPVVRQEPPPPQRPRPVSPAPARPAPPPTNGKVQF